MNHIVDAHVAYCTAIADLSRDKTKLLEHIKRLEEAGDAMTNCIACGCNDGGCTTCRRYEDKWTKAKEAKL